MNLEEVKVLLNTTSTSMDNFILGELPVIEDWVENWCNDDFLSLTSEGSTSTFKNYPEGIKRYIAKQINNDYVNMVGVLSESLGDYSVTYMANNTNANANPLLSMLKPYRKVGFV